MHEHKVMFVMFVYAGAVWWWWRRQRRRRRQYDENWGCVSGVGWEGSCSR